MGIQIAIAGHPAISRAIARIAGAAELSANGGAGVSQLADLVPGGIARIPGAGGSRHLVVPPLRNTTSQVRPGGDSSRAGSATNQIVATASPRTRIMSGTTGLGSLVGPREPTLPNATPLTPTTPLAADTYPASTVCSSHRYPDRGTPGATVTCLSSRHGREARLRCSRRRVRVSTRTRERADRAHDHNTGRFEPVGVFACEGGPASGVLVARAAALRADLQHVARHRDAEFRGFPASAQVAERTVLACPMGASTG